MPCYRFDTVVVDTVARQITRAGTGIELAPKLFDLLVLLLENAGQTVSRERMLERLWPQVIVANETVARTVSMLRQALGDEGHRLIQTVAKNGYRLTATVRVDAPPSPAAVAVEAPPAEPPAEPADRPERAAAPPRARHRIRGWLLGTAAILIAASIGWLLHRPAPGWVVLALSTPAGSESSAPHWQASAALSLLSDQLRDLPGLMIVRTLPGDDPIGRAEAAWVLEATLSNASGQEMLDWTLRSARQRTQVRIWQTPAAAGDLNPAVRTARRELTQQLGLGAAEPGRAMSELPDEALQNYAAALAHWERGRLRQARTELERARDLAPNVAVLHADLAQLLTDLGYDGLAHAHARRALELSDATPRTATAIMMRARALMLAGEPEAALPLLSGLAERAPETAAIQLPLLLTLREASRYEDLLASADRLLGSTATSPALRARALKAKATALLMMHRFPESLTLARQAVDAALALDEPVLAGQARLALCDALNRTGDRAAARAAIASAQSDFERAGEPALILRARAIGMHMDAAGGAAIDSAEANRLLAEARASGNSAIERLINGTLLEQAFNTGDAAAATAYARTRLVLDNDPTNEANHQYAQIKLASVLRYSGALEEAAQLLADLKPADQHMADPAYLNEISAAVAYERRAALAEPASGLTDTPTAPIEKQLLDNGRPPCSQLRAAVITATIAALDIAALRLRCQDAAVHDADNAFVLAEAEAVLARSAAVPADSDAIVRRLESALATMPLMQDQLDSLGRTVLALSDVRGMKEPALRRLSTLVATAQARPLLPLPRARLHLAQASLLRRLDQPSEAAAQARQAADILPAAYTRIRNAAQNLIDAAGAVPIAPSAS